MEKNNWALDLHFQGRNPVFEIFTSISGKVFPNWKNLFAVKANHLTWLIRKATVCFNSTPHCEKRELNPPYQARPQKAFFLFFGIVGLTSWVCASNCHSLLFSETIWNSYPSESNQYNKQTKNIIQTCYYYPTSTSSGKPNPCAELSPGMHF